MIRPLARDARKRLRAMFSPVQVDMPDYDDMTDEELRDELRHLDENALQVTNSLDLLAFKNVRGEIQAALDRKKVKEPSLSCD